MNKLLLTIFVFIVLISCNKQEQKKYYSDGVLDSILYTNYDSSLKLVEKYNRSGNLEFKFFYKNGNYDSIIKYNRNGKLNFIKKILPSGGVYTIEYDRSGNLYREGLYVGDSIKAYWWKYYNKDKLNAKRQYTIVCGKSYLNQGIIFDEKGDTLFNKSTFFSARKIITNDSFKLKYKLNSIFKSNKLDLVILQGGNCEEKPDTVIALLQNKGEITLNMKYFDRKAFFFDYNINRYNSSTDDSLTMKSRKMYIDLGNIGNGIN